MKGEIVFIIYKMDNIYCKGCVSNNCKHGNGFLQSYPSCNQEMEGANLISGQEVSLDQSMNGNPG